MREDPKETCMTCIHARHAGELTRTMGLYFCPVLVQPTREYADSDTITHILVHGEGVGCHDDYDKDEAEFEYVWRYELAEERREEGKTLEQIYGVIPGVDFPATL